MIKAVVVDDEFGAIEILKKYISNISSIKLVQSFQSAPKALDYIMKNDVDVIFLDINMPELNGMHLAKLIKSRKIKIIFSTASSEHAVESYTIEAVDYLLKPYSYQRFLKAVLKLYEKSNDMTINNSSLFIKSGTVIHHIEKKDILFLKKDGHYIEFYSLNKSKILSRMNTSEVLNLLSSDFIQVHRSYIVSISKIDTIDNDFVIIGKTKIPIGIKYRERLHQLILK